MKSCTLLVSIVAIVSTVNALSTYPPNATVPESPSKKLLQNCDCFTVSGSDPGYFQHYRLWDFRSIPLGEESRPKWISPEEAWQDSDEDHDMEDEDLEDQTDPDDEKELPGPDSVLFFETSFEKDWSSQKWQRRRTPDAPVAMINSKRNVFLTKDHERNDSDSTYLVMRTTRHANYTSTAEIETRTRNIYGCSVRVRLRLLPADAAVAQPPQPKEWPPVSPQQHGRPVLNNGSVPVNNTNRPPTGACAGIFTYHSFNCESDIEILTSDPSNRVHYANQPDYDPAKDDMIPGASTVVDMPVAWTSWATHRLDWLSDQSRWYVDNKLQESKSYRVPNRQSMVVINLWSDGGVWTGDMKLGDSIYMGIEYIELAYNLTTDRSNRLGIPSSQLHGGHQQPLANLFTVNSSESEVDVNGVTKKHRKCRKGRKGRKCRRRNKHRKGHRGGKGHHDGSCRRPCHIDNLHPDLVG
ncbi:hypothetical protein NUU61_004199 [Penicillium alfredii]|uniref:GH16 domain-containing protein n=1 Tax=Penicillium alfredii TaxID=1506179 RepID=A0A9W9FL57_9EURO|nr:uncharacterized protein NUU61_004199 [Penicillium alfredii]KAJ5101977.1 hypothetical protein NUU61_004199 [Penicillium alfredii]